MTICTLCIIDFSLSVQIYSKKTEKYTTTEKIEADKEEKEKFKIKLSNNTYAICEYLEMIAKQLRGLNG